MTEPYTDGQLQALASACRDELERARTMLLFALLHDTTRGDRLAHFMVAEASVRSVLGHIEEARDREWPRRASSASASAPPAVATMSSDELDALMAKIKTELRQRVAAPPGPREPVRRYLHAIPDLSGDDTGPHPCVGAPACDVCEAREQDAYVVSALLARAMGAGL